MTYPVGITATRHGGSRAQLRVLFKFLCDIADEYESKQRGNIDLHHGDCIGGDAQAHCLAMACGFNITIHPPIKDTHRAFCFSDHPDVKVLDPKPYMSRNRDIVQASNILLALPREFLYSDHSGTWKTIKLAQDSRRAWIIIFPDGTVQQEAAR